MVCKRCGLDHEVVWHNISSTIANVGMVAGSLDVSERDVLLDCARELVKIDHPVVTKSCLCCGEADHPSSCRWAR